MPRTIWSGSISFGLVNIPVRLHTAVTNRSVQFHMLSDDGQCRLRRKLVCPETGQEYDFSETSRGYEIAPDQYVIITNEELDALKPEAGRTIDIKDFVDLAEIDPVYYDRPYYLAPEERGVRAYRLLLQAMTESSKVGIATFVMRSRQYLAALRPVRNAICLETMRFADELVALDEIEPEAAAAEPDKREMDIAQRLIDALAGPFEPEKYRDEYRERVMELIERKAGGEEVITQPSVSQDRGKVINLMDALEASIAETRKGRGASRRKKTA